MDDVSQAAQKTSDVAEWGGVALMAVTAVSVLALVVAVIALGRTSGYQALTAPE